MKHFIFFITIFWSATLMAQIPYSFSYQGVARNAAGEELKNQAISVNISISGPGGSYGETQQATTNEFGLFTLNIGAGNGLKDIKWEDGGMQMTVSVNAGAGGSVSGTSQLNSVPYALVSGRAVALSEDASVALDQIDRGGAMVGQVLKWNGTRWVPSNDDIGSGGGTGGPPTGPAGGDLTGNYPNPFILPGAINTPKIENGAVTNEKLANGSVTSNKLGQSGASAGQVLKWNGSAWTPANDEVGGGGGGAPSGPAGGDLNGTYPNPTVNRIQNRTVSNATPANGQVLKWNGSSWTPSNDEVGGGGGGAPSGPAGGDLSGTYPNPSVNRIQNRTVSNATPANGQVLKWNGSAWTPSNDESGLTLPYAGSASNSTEAFKVTQNTASGTAIEAVNGNLKASLAGKGIGAEFFGGIKSTGGGGTFGVPAGNFIGGVEISSGNLSITSSTGNFINLIHTNSTNWSIETSSSFKLNAAGQEAFSFSPPGGIVGFMTLRPGTDNTHNLGSSSNRWRTVFATTGTINTSDRNLKRDINHISYGLESVRKLNPVSYKWNDDENSRTHLGFIAQEVEEILPEVITKDENGRYGMNYAEVIPVLVKAIQELTEKVQHLEQKYGLVAESNKE